LAPAVSKKRHYSAIIRPGLEAPVVMQHSRHDAGRAVVGSGDHLSAGGIFFVDRERIGVDPQSNACMGFAGRRVINCRYSLGARRLTPNTPGSSPWASNPRRTQSCMTLPNAQ